MSAFGRDLAALREQARLALEGFLQGVLDEPANAAELGSRRDLQALAKVLWAEGLALACRLLFLLKLEAPRDPRRAPGFTSDPPFRARYSPSAALAPRARAELAGASDRAACGVPLAADLRALFALFQGDDALGGLVVHPIEGGIFCREATTLLDRLTWPEHAVALLLDGLVWTPRGEGRVDRSRIRYEDLDVEDLGHVYEALLDIEPGIAAEPMCRLRRRSLEIVVPAAEGDRHGARKPSPAGGQASTRGAKSRASITRVEEIPAGRFFLRAGLGRKAAGSYYTPGALVRFLVREALGPRIAERSPADDPRPSALLSLKVLDPAMGSGHFLVEACRVLGDSLLAACHACLALAAEAERAGDAVRARELRGRVDELPGGGRGLAMEGEALPSPEAISASRRLIAMHCLYGVDKDPIAVELAKLSLWLESHSGALPPAYLDRRLLTGDSLTGPLLKELVRSPRWGEPLAGPLAARLQERFAEAMTTPEGRARDEAIEPLRLLAAAWSGGVMLGDGADDEAYEALARAVAAKEDAPASPVLARMVAAGSHGVAYELAFPEVFGAPDGQSAGRPRGGFDAVLGNPPWDAMQPLAKEFYAALDLRILDAPTRLERAGVLSRFAKDAAVERAFSEYVAGFEALKRVVDRCFAHVNRRDGGAPSSAVTDRWQCFAERGRDLLGEGGALALVLPSAFHANQSATGVRQLFLNEMQILACFSFENRRGIFDIHGSFRFDLVVARRGGSPTGSFACAFRLRDVEWLSQGRSDALCYTRAFIETTGGPYLTFPELGAAGDVEVARACFEGAESMGAARRRLGIRIHVEIDMSKGAHLFTPVEKESCLAPDLDPREPAVARALLARGYLPLHEGKTFHQYTDRWEERPRYLVAAAAVAGRAGWARAARHYRLSFRAVASSTNERTAIMALLPPGVVFGNSSPCEREPDGRPHSSALLLLACVNSFVFDWCVRQRSAANINLFILDGCPVPTAALSPPLAGFLIHAALRLTCTHEGYAPLFHEQLGSAWREAAPPFTWPVLRAESDRWAVRAAADAVVARAYGLSRAQYARVLASFRHKGFPRAPELCLGAFDALLARGDHEFVRMFDPYADILPVMRLPEPAAEWQPAAASMGMGAPERRRRRADE